MTLLLSLVLLLPGACQKGDEVAGPDTGPEDDRGSSAGDDAGDTEGDGDVGDSAAGSPDSVVDSDPGDGAYTYECVSVGVSDSDGFFALRGYGDRLYAGQFGYGREAQSMLYRFSPWERVEPGLTGISESVCALMSFGGQLYANTESSGDIFRSADGATWTRVYDGGDHTIGCALEVFDGALYAVNYDNGDREAGRILRSADGASWSEVYSSGGQPLYLRELVAHDGALYAFAVDEDTSQGYQLRSTDGASWSISETPSRFFRAHSWGDLYIGSADRTSNGVSGIWRVDGGSPELVHSEPRHYVTELIDWDGALWAGTSDGWKEDEGTSALLRSADGETWEEVCQFSEIAIWSIAVAGDTLYAGTWQYGDGGAVYAVNKVAAEDPGDTGDPGVDCALIPGANAAWELCEEGADYCAGVYTDGAGCAAYCAAAGLSCAARWGGEPGCQKEPDNPIACSEVNDHQSDWCECR